MSEYPPSVEIPSQHIPIELTLEALIEAPEGDAEHVLNKDFGFSEVERQGTDIFVVRTTIPHFTDFYPVMKELHDCAFRIVDMQFGHNEKEEVVILQRAA